MGMISVPASLRSHCCNHCNAKVFGAGMGISMIVAEASLVPRGAR